MTPPPLPDPICVRVNDVARMVGVGRTKLYELIVAGEIEAVKIGKATRVTTASLHDLIKRRPKAGRKWGQWRFDLFESLGQTDHQVHAFV